MRTFVMLILVVLVVEGGPSMGVSCETKASLFTIERSKNGNLVQYDVCLDENGNLPDSNPVSVYWVLENGANEELNPIEKKFCYGIKSQERLGKNRFGIYVAALKDRRITVEKIGNNYKALISINGKPCVLEKIFVGTEERKVGFPKVLYVDLFGRTQNRSAPVKERISRT